MRTLTIMGALLSIGFMLSAQVSIDTNQLRLDTLENGLRIISYRDTSTNLSISQMAFHAGSKYDRADQSGVAYLVHQLLINEQIGGNSNQGTKEVINYITGGKTSRFFTKDYSIYQQVFTASQLESVFQLESERLNASNFSTSRLNRKRKILADENKPIALVQPEFIPIDLKLYHGHPYQLPLKGYSDQIEGTTNSEVRNFVRRYYAANRAILTITSPYPADTIVSLAKKYFSRWPKGNYQDSRINLPLPSTDTIILDTLASPVISLPSGFIAYPLPTKEDTAYYDLEELGNCTFSFSDFFVPMDSTLKQKVGFFNSGLKTEKDANHWVVQFTPKINQSIDSIFSSIDATFNYYQDSLINEALWRKCCSTSQPIMVSDENIFERRNQILMRNMLETNKPLGIPHVPITREKLKSIVKQYFRPEKSIRIILLPSKLN